MGYEEEPDEKVREEAMRRRRRRRSATPQKISLFSVPLQLPQQSPDHSGTLTPPFRSPASVPFLWEEAPGKPRRPSNSFSSVISRSLELPPRLHSNSSPSPITVLRGPDVGRCSSCISSSFGRSPHTLLGSFRRFTGNPDYGDSGDGFLQLGSLLHSKIRDVSVSSREYFGSFRKKVSTSSSSNFQRIQDVIDESNLFISDSSSFSVAAAHVGVGLGGVGGGGTANSKGTKSSHLWANIYQGFKQAVPWRSRKKKKKKDGDVDVD